MMFFETSAKTGENVDTCFIGMTHEIFKKIDRGEYDLTNESLGITPLKPILLKNSNNEINQAGIFGKCKC